MASSSQYTALHVSDEKVAPTFINDLFYSFILTSVKVCILLLNNSFITFNTEPLPLNSHRYFYKVPVVGASSLSAETPPQSILLCSL